MKRKCAIFKNFCGFILVTCIIVEVLDFSFNKSQMGEYVHDDMGLTIDELIKKHGYHFENHTLMTDDGYILEMHRLYTTKVSQMANPKVVLFMHGIMHSSITWVTGGPSHAIAYHFADKDYDVWLGNVRGNIYTRKHRDLQPDYHKKAFFNYSWHEFGAHDVPAQIDYVLAHTKRNKIVYVGHSQGFLSLLVTLSEKPSYNDKIHLFVGLAPAVYLQHVQSPFIRTIAYFQSFFEWLSERYIHEVPAAYTPRTSFLTEFGNRYCNDDRWVGQHFCYFCYSVAGGFHYKKMNKTLLPLIFSHAFCGASSKQVLHYTQVKNSGIFRKYDYGRKKNLAHYGQETPPEYNFNNMNVPIAIYYSLNDWAVGEMDVVKLINKLPNVIHSSIPDPHYAHFDFMMGMNGTEFYDSVTNITERYYHF